MGIVFRQSAKNSIVVALGAILGALVIWLSTKYLTKPQLGFTRNLTNYAVTFSQLLLLGLSSTLAVYIHRFANNEHKRKALLTFCLLTPLVFVAIFTIAYFSLHTWILHHFQPADLPFMERYFSWLPLYTLLFMYMVLLEQYLGSLYKVAISAFMREVVVRVANILLILLYGFGYVSFDILVIGSVLIYALPVLIFLLLAMQSKGFGLSFNGGHFSKTEYKEMVHFSWYHFLLTISVLLMSYMDALSLPFYDHNGFSDVALYAVAVYFISFLQLPLKAMLPASFTVLAKAFADNDMPKAKDIFARSSINILIPTAGIAVLVCCNLNNVIMVIKNDYSEIIPVFAILFIGNIVNIATGMNDQVLSIANYYKFNFYLSLTLIGILYLLIRVLVPRYGIYGAAWSTTTILMLFNFLKYFFIWRKLDMQPFSRKTPLVIFAAAMALAGGYFFPHLFDQSHHVYIRTFLDVVIRSSVIVVIYMLMLLWLKPSADLEEYIASIRKNKRLF